MSALAKTAKDLDHIAARSLVGLKFQSNRSANFAYVLNVVSKAHTFYQVDQIYLAVFTNTLDQMRLLSVVLQEVRNWKQVTLFANGRPQSNRSPMINMLNSLLTASTCKKHQDHCHEVIEDPFTIDPKNREVLTIDFLGNDIWNVEKRSERWLLPCKHLKGFLRLHVDDKPRAKEKLEALALERNCNLCPYFRAEDFKAL